MFRRIFSPAILAITLTILLAGGIGLAAVMSSSNYTLTQLTTTGNSHTATSTGYQANLTSGYPALGTTGSSSYQLDLGFWTGSDSSGDGRLYFPIVYKNPTPTPPPIVLVYEENFNSGEPWIEFDSGGCDAYHSNAQYWVELTEDNNCWPPADSDANRTEGEFQVDAYQSGDSGKRGNAAYGLFINGAGGDYNYLFRIWPNNSCSSGGDWELLRTSGGNTSTVAQGDCNTAIKRGFGSDYTNTLKITHNSNVISVYVNGTLLRSYTDSAPLTGTATGIYLKSTDTPILIKYDNFKVYRYP